MTAHPELHTPLTDLLVDWLPKQRWFGSKGSPIVEVHVEAATPLMVATDAQPQLTHLVVAVETAEGTDRYQLLLGKRSGEVEERLRHVAIGDHEGSTYYDAAHDPLATSALLGALATDGMIGALEFTNAAPIDPALAGRVMTAEQSNTSVVFGDAYIFKLFRRLQPGANPDIEVTKALVDAGSTVVPRPLAWFDGRLDGEITTFGLLQTFLKGASEGWAMATASVRDLFAEADLRADEVGGDFASEAERLGLATAEVHTLMAQSLQTQEVGAEDYVATAAQLHARLDAAIVVVPDLAEHADSLRALYDDFGRRTDPVVVQRVHGDLHLGQVLRTQDGWVVLDFEGEPARPLAERTALMNPLRDVAGMLRSFDYAARYLLVERGSGDAQLAFRAAEWAARNRAAFCEGYARGGGIDPRKEPLSLKVFELDKAVYEVVYEARNRPAWLPVPLGSIARIVEEGA